METIKSYLDNMFASLPKTARVLDLKNNILSNMEEKYNELKRQGKSENEAIGIVISEFGNIDELVSELGIHKDDEVNTKPVVTTDEVEAYIHVKRTVGIQVGVGVFLCIAAAGVFLLLNYLVENKIITDRLNGSAASVPGLIALFLLITIAVGIFIYSGMNFERFKYMEEGVQLPASLESELKKRYERETPSYYLNIIAGVCLIIISPVAIFLTNLMDDSDSIIGVVILLFIVAFAVTLFITAGTKRESLSRLLKIGDYSPVITETRKKSDKVIGAVASIVWPLAAAIFLFCGFVYHLWAVAWVIFPITGILFGMFSAAYSTIKGSSES